MNLDCDFNFFTTIGYHIKTKQIKMVLMTLSTPQVEPITNPPVSFDNYLNVWIDKTNEKRKIKQLAPMNKDNLINEWRATYS